MRNKLLIFLSITLIALGVVGIKTILFFNQNSNNESLAILEVDKGEGFNKVINRLVEKNIIRKSDKLSFKILGRVTGKDKNIKVGEYEVPAKVKPSRLLAILSSGKSRAYSLLIVEGDNIYEVADKVGKTGIANKQESLSYFTNAENVKKLLGEERPSLEGYLFPETYSYTKFTSLKELVSQMVKRTLKSYNQFKQESKTNLSRHEIITLASIIEKETGVGYERPLIASVFYNRIKKNMKLQTDPTILYGMLIETGTMPTNIRKKDILKPNKYNTYTFKGLPIGPIANPGHEAIKAALLPDTDDFYYFVSKNDGSHHFSKTYKEHNAAVIEYQIKRRKK